MNKKVLARLVVEWSFCFAMVYWLVAGSIWLDLFLASALSHCIDLSRRVRYQRVLFDIADAELVRVSSLAEGLEKELGDVIGKLEQAEAEIAELKSKCNA